MNPGEVQQFFKENAVKYVLAPLAGTEWIPGERGAV